MDDFAIQSLTRAKNAIEQGLLKAETAAVEVKTRRETITVVDDEQLTRAASTRYLVCERRLPDEYDHRSECQLDFRRRQRAYSRERVRCQRIWSDTNG